MSSVSGQQPAETGAGYDQHERGDIEVRDRTPAIAEQSQQGEAQAQQGRACDLVALADASWVLRVEPDQPVHTMHTKDTE